MNLAEKIRTLRVEKGLKQEELAELVGTKRWSINQYENGIQRPHKKTLIALAAALGVDADLLGNDEAELHTDEEIIDRFGADIKEKYGEDAKKGFKKMVLNNRPMFAGGLMPEQDRDKFIEAVAVTYLKFCELSIEKYGKVMIDDDTGE
ncbi:helix-turn-helix transcriptional regulator [Ruminococcus sp.]|uniref:helix-turn-helix domain-containing protein n=1 Tax=Ruminococcus sp. TaxID=41978 RepID=UPI0025FB489C|nr:helix-turn-helix transcriptional regulator [Ruminococcus sp.]MBR1433279.1 helix-turn-helix transcriptional regulator [Ruminococcus sp.]